jgi:hypothetical protein
LSDLERVGSLLSLHGAGVLEVNAIGTTAWMRACKAYRLLPPLEHLLWEREPQIMAVPLRRAGRYLERVPSALIWARTRSSRQAAALRNFRPMPDVVIREGIGYTAFWALTDALTRDGTLRANRRLAKRLGTPYTACDTNMGFHLPGAVLRTARGRPVPVELVRFEPAVHAILEVVGRLPDPPSEEQIAEARARRRERAAQS